MSILTGCLYSLGVYTGLNILSDLATGVTLRDQGDQDFPMTGCLDIGLNILSDLATGVTLRDQGNQNFLSLGVYTGLNILSDLATGVTLRDQGDQDFPITGCLYSLGVYTHWVSIQDLIY